MSGLQGRLAESKAGAVTELGNRRVQAQQGAQFAISNARSQLSTELAKIFQRQQDLRREKGAFAAATMGQLREAAQQRSQQLHIENLGNRQSERNSLRSAGIDPATGKPIKGGALDPNAPRYKDKGGSGSGGSSAPKATQEMQRDARKQIGTAIDYAREFKKDNLSRAEAAQQLRRGAKEEQIPVLGRDGKPVLEKQPDGTFRKKMETLAPVPKVEDDLMLRAALDMAYDGHLSKHTQRLLHANGYRVKPLPVTTREEYRRRRRARDLRSPTEDKIRAGVVKGPPIPR
jgi:hypothetical protein